MFASKIKKILERRYYPLVISETGTEEKLSQAEDKLVWDHFDLLDQTRQQQLLAYEMPEKIQELQQKFTLDGNMIAQISLCIRKLFFGELDLPGAEAKIGSLLAQTPGGDPNKAKDIVSFIDREILHLVPKPVERETTEIEPSMSPSKGVIKKPLLSAMSEYPRLGDQNITANRIKTKQSPEPMRGSLTNWIHYYRDELGIGFHDQVLRGKFLFQSENGKRLSGEEREHLNVILKSIEEEFPLEIDTDRQMILFPRVQAREMSERREVVRTAAPQPTPQPVSWAIPKPSPAFTFGKPGVISPRVNPAPRPAAAVPRPSLGETDMKPAANIADATLHFSTGHVLPAEKAALGVQAAPSTETSSLKNTVSSASAGSGQRIVPQPNPNRSPYSIRPLRPRE